MKGKKRKPGSGARRLKGDFPEPASGRRRLNQLSSSVSPLNHLPS